MISKNLRPQIFLPIKGLSIFLITSALCLELGNICLYFKEISTQPFFQMIFAIERLALIIHFLEAVIAFFYAHLKNRIPLNYSIYTFFVGTIGLLELFNNEDI